MGPTNFGRKLSMFAKLAVVALLATLIHGATPSTANLAVVTDSANPYMAYSCEDKTVHTLNSGTQVSCIYREHTGTGHKRWEHRIKAKTTPGTYYDYYTCADSANGSHNDGLATFSGKVVILSQGGGG